MSDHAPRPKPKGVHATSHPSQGDPPQGRPRRSVRSVGAPRVRAACARECETTKGGVRVFRRGAGDRATRRTDTRARAITQPRGGVGARSLGQSQGEEARSTRAGRQRALAYPTIVAVLVVLFTMQETEKPAVARAGGERSLRSPPPTVIHLRSSRRTLSALLRRLVATLLRPAHRPTHCRLHSLSLVRMLLPLDLLLCLCSATP